MNNKSEQLLYDLLIVRYRFLSKLQISKRETVTASGKGEQQLQE